MYFPQLTYLTTMVKKVSKPIAYLVFIMLLFFFAFSTLLYALYSTKMEGFRNFLYTTVTVVRFMQGGIQDWKVLAQDYSFMWPVIMIIAFLFNNMVLGALPIAIFASHKKEKELCENYSYHPFWASERTKQGRDPKEFNPATQGMSKEEAAKYGKAR